MNEQDLAKLGDVVQTLSGEFAIVKADMVIFRGTASEFMATPSAPLESCIYEIFVTDNVLHIRIDRKGLN